MLVCRFCSVYRGGVGRVSGGRKSQVLGVDQFVGLKERRGEVGNVFLVRLLREEQITYEGH